MFENIIDSDDHETDGLAIYKRYEDVSVHYFTDCRWILFSSFLMFNSKSFFIILLWIFEMVAEALHDTCEMSCSRLLWRLLIHHEFLNCVVFPQSGVLELILLSHVFTVYIGILLRRLLTQLNKGVNQSCRKRQYRQDYYVNENTLDIPFKFRKMSVFPNDISWFGSLIYLYVFSEEPALWISIIDQSSVISFFRFKSTKYCTWSLQVIEHSRIVLQSSCYLFIDLLRPLPQLKFQVYSS